MDTIERVSSQIKQCGIIAILRGDFSIEDMLRISEALLAGNVTVMEVTLNSTSALEALPRLREHFAEKMLVGAGTVRDVKQAQQAMDAGAQFLVSPNFDSETVSFTRSRGLLHLPGVFTATEAQHAFNAGCRMLKLFPMEAAGPSYVKALRAPLNDIDFVPTGGISLENIKEYARAGAVAVGMGSKLVLNKEQTSPDLTGKAKALREAWMMGQAGGGAIADVLFGITNPSGKLAEAFPMRLADTPAHINFPGGNGEVNYGEGLFIGYRYYDYRDVDVQFPFGYGLSYTTFEYSKPKVSSKNFKDVDGITVSVDVTNRGKVAGREIVQVYVRDVQSKLVRPLKELKGFAKVELKPAETKTAAIKLDFRSFAYYHPGHKQWITENGEYEILIGASSRDIHFTETVELESTQVLPSILNRESTIRAWLEDPQGGPIFEPIYQQILAGMAAMFGAEKDEGADIGMDMTGFLMEMPLLSIFQFQESALPAPAVDMVDSLLKTVHEAEAG